MEATGRFHLTTRQKRLLPVLLMASFFEGFDWMVINLALPYITKDLHLNTQQAGMVAAIIAIGALVSFFVVRMGDRVGRRPVFITSIVLYSVFSILTALTKSVELFVAFQFLARIFLVSEWMTGIIVVSEEFPVEYRGRGISLFQSASAIGAIFPTIFLPVMSALNLGWRGLYFLGGLPLLVIIFLGRNFKETSRFQQTRETKTETGPGMFDVFQPVYRKYMVTVMALWFLIYLCYASVLTFWSYHVVNELNWTEQMVSIAMGVSYVLGLLGYVAVGKLMDSLGRKKTAIIFFVLGAFATVANFQATSFTAIMILLTLQCLTVGTFVVICSNFTAELFPTEIRANASAWGNNVAGRLGTIAAPMLVGFMASPLATVGNAVSVMALGPLIAAVLVAAILPETRGREIN